MNRALRNIFIAAAGLAVITACGGGSDDGGGLGGGVPPAEPASITVENAPLIAGSVAEVAMGQGVFTSIFAPAIPIGSVGELRIEGAGGAVIAMIALDANTVRLQIDIDGDGATDETVDMTWDELMAAAA